MQVQAQLSQEGSRVVTVNYDFGSDLASAVEKFGAEVIFTKFRAAAIIDLQALVRRAIKLTGDKAKTDEQIQAIVDVWKPKVAVLGSGGNKPTSETLFAKAKGLSAEEKKALFEKLQAELGNS